MTSAVHHDLKVWKRFFDVVNGGDKSFELRFDDRGFRVGDTLVLREWDDDMQRYTGRLTEKVVTYILAGPLFGLQEGFVAMAIK